jgi:hypothetical protein
VAGWQQDQKTPDVAALDAFQGMANGPDVGASMERGARPQFQEGPLYEGE